MLTVRNYGLIEKAPNSMVTFSGLFSSAIICLILSSRPLRTAHIRSSRVTSSLLVMYFLLQYGSEVSSMYFSPCSFARFRFSSRSVKDSFFELQKISFDFFYFVTFCFNFLKTIFGALLDSLRFSFIENRFRQSINIIPSSTFFVV